VKVRVVAALASLSLVCGAVSVGVSAAVDTKPRKKCHPSNKGACLDPNASDYDCKGGRGDGPKYTGKVRVVGADVFRLDADHDGWGCERDWR
jgi:hypothetical protein